MGSTLKAVLERKPGLGPQHPLGVVGIHMAPGPVGSPCPLEAGRTSCGHRRSAGMAFLLGEARSKKQGPRPVRGRVVEPERVSLLTHGLAGLTLREIH